MITRVGTDSTAATPAVIASATTVSTAVGPSSVTMPIALLPPMTVPGEKPSARGVGASTVSVAAALILLTEAVMVTGILAATAAVTIGKEATRLPAGTRTVAGTPAIDGW